MRRTIGILFLGVVGAACVSLTPGGAKVRVYQADVESAEAVAPPLPDGCRLLGTSGPIEQQYEALEQSDPYRVQRNETAALGGNVLYLSSYLFRRLLKTDCPIGAAAASGCENNSQNWYRVSFRSYACDAPALAELAESPEPISPSVFRIAFGKKTTPTPAPVGAAAAEPEAPPAGTVAHIVPTPGVAVPVSIGADALKTKILDLMHADVGTDVILSFVRANRPATPLTADEIIDWKKSGIPDEVIRATFPD
jgi:hypothetical protein